MAITTKELGTFFKKKGFIYPSSEIYGGVAGLYDYGHLGTKLKRNFENAWRKYFLSLHDNFYEIETANIMHGKVFEASGHLKNFYDPLVRCSKCGLFERADHFIERELKTRAEGLSGEDYDKLIEENNLKCHKCQSKLLPVTVFNLMFPLEMGALSGKKSYLRPETAQSPYVNFRLQYEMLRKKLPMGLALIGRAYRNEISPRNLTLRQREFTQAELQIFFNPDNIVEHPDFESIKDVKLRTLMEQDREKGEVVERSANELVEKHNLPKFYIYHLAKIQQFYFDVMKIPVEKFRLYQLDDKEKAFYNKYHFDLEIDLTEHGFTEVGGLHYRTDHDLTGHQKVSKQKMEVMDEESGKRFIPHVLELSFGVDRNVYSLLDLGYAEDSERGNVALNFPRTMAPFFCAVFPLVKKDEKLVSKAKGIFNELKTCYSCVYDEAASIGRRYARQDEIGTKICITVDSQSLEDDTITLRELDSRKQIRVKTTELNNALYKYYLGEEFGKLV